MFFDNMRNNNCKDCKIPKATEVQLCISDASLFPFTLFRFSLFPFSSFYLFFPTYLSVSDMK